MKRLKAFDGNRLRDVYNVIWKEDGSWRANLVESKSECEESGFIDSDTLNTMLLRPVCKKDANGNEIYECDIVGYDPCEPPFDYLESEINYKEGCFLIGENYPISCFQSGDLKIVGNKFEKLGEKVK